MRNEVSTLLIADDHPLIRHALEKLVTEIPQIQLLGVAEDGAEALHMISTLKPHIALLDIDMPLLDGLSVLEMATKQNLDTKIVLLTFHKERSVYDKAVASGAAGYLLKDFDVDEIKQCLLAVRNNTFYVSRALHTRLSSNPALDKLDRLTNTELKVVRLIASGKTTPQIAGMLFVSPKTVENHRSNISKKLDLRQSGNSLLKWAIQHRADLE